MPGAGHSSITFWCRRCTLHSRSPSAHTVPCRSASTWTSTCRARSSSGSAKTVPSPKADAASRRADSTSRASSPASRTTRIPRPPPPADAFTSSGNSAGTEAGPDRSYEGSTGTPASAISRLAPILTPMAAMASGGGPIHTSPAPITARAKSAFSDRKP